MQFFEQQVREDANAIFYQAPSPFTKYTNKQQLRYCVGAALYMPATRKTVAQEIIERKYPAVTTIILDLEDALGDKEVALGLAQLKITVEALQAAIHNAQLTVDHVPLIFVRVRHAEQLQHVIALLGEGQHVLTGYVLPKFTAQNGRALLAQIVAQNEAGYTLYAMPILESADIFLKEHRMAQLLAVRALLEEFYPYILNVRIGTTDFSGLLGIRRMIRHTVYDLQPVRDCMTDILNVFLREELQFVLSGPVWEYFDQAGNSNGAAMEGLLREVELDCLNGFVGKTIIHPTHIEAVQAVYAVSHEEFIDAQTICALIKEQVGVQKSAYGNKMNEMKPHALWAQRLLCRAEAYGVLMPGRHYTELLKGQVTG